MNNNFVKENKNGVVYFRCTEIATPHGFSTRLGGVSTLPHLAQMNLGKTLGDDPEKVEKNYEIIANAIGFDKESIVYTKQIHSNIVKIVDEKDCGNTYDLDGFVTNKKNVTLAVRYADCTPILFYDEKASVIGAVHAGWRGTVSKIQVEAIEKMASLGADTKNIKCAIGSCIHKCCYEVGEDFYNTVLPLLGEELTNKYVDFFGHTKRHADLVGLNRELLINAGVKEENISVFPDCTCCNPELYFSHRASKGKRGVMSAFITLK